MDEGRERFVPSDTKTDMPKTYFIEKERLLEEQKKKDEELKEVKDKLLVEKKK